MISAEHILKGLLSSALSSGFRRNRSRRRTVNISGRDLMKLGMGAIGVAMAAYEHFSAKDGQQPQSPASTPPPPPPPSMKSSSHESNEGSSDKNELLLKVMIAAALSDGELSDEEREKIYSKLAEEGLNNEEREYLDRLISSPATVTELSAGIEDRALAEEMYAAALVAIDLDTPAERRFLDSLSSALNLSQDQRTRWNNIFGVA